MEFKRKVVQIVCILLLNVLNSSCNYEEKAINDAGILDTVITSLSQIDNDMSKSLCSEAYTKEVGGFYAVHDADDIVAITFYEEMQRKGFVPSHPMRQDYEAWTGSLYTPRKERLLVFNIRTVIDADKDMGSSFEARRLGYKTMVNISLLDPDQ